MAILAGSTLMLLGANLVTLLIPWLMGRFADSALGGSKLDGFGVSLLLVVILLIFIIQTGLSYTFSIFSGNRCEILAVDIKNKVYCHLQKLPVLELAKFKKGHLINLFSDD
ncbi:MAG TPA: ABC transporter ATP-binding protein, partial [Dehalococcoidia bacterium]|nr:ABC transporter ATP-binding protein [Dehalococcoidia bacterium]